MQKFYVNFQVQSLFHTYCKTIQAPFLEIFHQTVNFSSWIWLLFELIISSFFAFSEALESHQDQFSSTFCTTALFYLCKISLIHWKEKKSHCQDGDRGKGCSEKLWSVILLWLTLLWAESLDEMVSRVFFHLQVFCDCLNFGSSNWIMIRNLCFTIYIFFLFSKEHCFLWNFYLKMIL